tara:strand:- start:209 stop:430 length:222 start_codon:yes stop_codon:yes gene_type:complete
MIDVQSGRLSLVAMKYVTTKMPMPYTALKAEKSIKERNAGDLLSRVKSGNFSPPSIHHAESFTSKYDVLLELV